jgi:hypothetical protein
LLSLKATKLKTQSHLAYCQGMGNPASLFGEKKHGILESIKM